MKSYDFFAVIYKGNVHCIECLPEKVSVSDETVHPIFANSEHDTYPVCDVCLKEHDYVCLTDWGKIHTSEHYEIFRDVTFFRYAGQTYFCAYHNHSYEHPEIISREQMHDMFVDLVQISYAYSVDMLDTYLEERYGL